MNVLALLAEEIAEKRAQIKALATEIERLRAEVAELRGEAKP